MSSLFLSAYLAVERNVNGSVYRELQRLNRCVRVMIVHIIPIVDYRHRKYHINIGSHCTNTRSYSTKIVSKLINSPALELM